MPGPLSELFTSSDEARQDQGPQEMHIAEDGTATPAEDPNAGGENGGIMLRSAAPDGPSDDWLEAQ